MNKQGLRSWIIKVPDLQAAKTWYTKAFRTEPYFDEPFYVGYNIAGYELGLHPETEPILDKKGNIFTYWGVEDVQIEFDRLLSLGASPFEKPENVGGEIITASVKDPWDNIIGIIFNPHFKLE